MQRILYLNEYGEIAGTENLLVAIMSQLDCSKYEPIMACPPGPVADRVLALGIQYIPFEFRLRRLKISVLGLPSKIINPAALVYKLIEGYSISRILRKYQIDILHTNSLSSHIAGILAARITNTPIIWHIHTHFPRLLYRGLLPNRMVFVSNFVARSAYPSGIPSIAKVIHNGIDTSDFDPSRLETEDIRAEFGISPSQPLVTMIGYLDPIKGQREMIEAWPKILAAHPSACLLVVGKLLAEDRAAYEVELHRRVEALGIAKSVIFTGFRSDIPAILRAADIYVSYTLNDTLSMMVIEAMTMGKAIIGANSGGVPELVMHKQTGLLVDRDDYTDLSQAVISLLNSPAQRAELGAAARQRALRLFHIQSCVTELERVYKDLISAG